VARLRIIGVKESVQLADLEKAKELINIAGNQKKESNGGPCCVVL
jgi:hypothetical protein